ncbi:MAG: preprotein translocase subunit YajC, partial [Gammaproteobacteria bacterium]|nr:preprotein translocase subunit YajC [Gammaproteobacteria bacterium]
MDFFIQNAYAQNTQQGDGTSFIIMMVLMFAAFYFLLIRPQQKKQKQHTELVAGLKVGDEVLTAGGILGKITGVS